MASGHADELSRALQDGFEEAVEVNQRGLIEKILARYSGQYTVFRELSQNADDAQASSVQIHFQTARSDVPVTALTSEPITRIVIKNDGIVFRDEDWRRLKTIADGQPNVESIGAFGVGFYSIWSISDQPLVVSGENMMEFVWRGQQLAVRRAKNPIKATEVSPANGRPWSSISMPCRNLEPMPDPASFSKFLATALPFTSHLRSMSLHFNEHELCTLSKLPAPARSLAIPGYMNTRSPQRMMQITEVDSTPVQMSCKVMRVALASLEAPAAKKSATASLKQSFATKFLSFATSQRQEPTATAAAAANTPAANPMEMQSASLFLSIITASAKITASASFIAEIERSTKKPPPTKTRLQVLFTLKDEADASDAGASAAAAAAVSPKAIFASLASDVGTQGKIYIGFPLFQTTGCASAVSARLIPTVEREQIDLNAKAIADYNRELLALAGVTCRILYDAEMSDIGSKLAKLGAASGTGSTDPARAWLESQATHLMRSYTFHPSTPLSEIGRIAQAAFFASNTKEYLLLSSKGVLPASRVRLPAPELSFLDGLPTVLDSTAKENPLLLEQLQERSLLSTVTIDDVVKQLNEKAFTVGQATSALQWWIGLSHNFNYDPRLLSRFSNALIISVPAENGREERVVPFASIKHYLNAKTIPPDMPFPATLLPYTISRAIPWSDLQRTFNLQELSIPEWLRHITSKELLADTERSIVLSPAFAEKTLGVVAKILPNLKPDQAAQSIGILKEVACIPTKQGMKKPGEAYSPKVTLFEDLPVTTLPAKGNMDRLLNALGVRAHVDLALVFSRLLGGGQWSQEEVAKYLVSVQSSLSADEIDRLKKTAWLTREIAPGTVAPAADAAASAAPPTRFRAKSLYEPNDALRELDLPVIAWNTGRWRPASDEAKLLYSMGLKRHPDAEEILKLAADPSNPTKQQRALDYFLANFESQYVSQYQPSTNHNLPFVPVLRGTETAFVKPSEAYTSVGANVLGFPALHPKYQMQAASFKLAPDPKPADLVAALLAKPPKNKDEATPIFAYLAGQASRFTAAEQNNLAFSRFIPAQTDENGPYNLYAPGSVYFQSANSVIGEQFRSLFVFVDFASSAANAFLLQVGVRAEPSIAEIAQLLLSDPNRFLTLAGSAERYISLLRQIAAQYGAFPTPIRKKMQTSPFLLGFERLKANGEDSKAPTNDDLEDDDDGLLTYRLGSASELVIIDDTTLLTEFRQYILACPQDDIIEAFVEQLGGKRLSKLVSTTFASSSIPETASPRAAGLRKLILERVTLFLHERQQTSKDVQYNEDWLRKNLAVREVTRIERQRVLTINKARFVKTSTASAAATAEKGTLLLRVASTLEDDFYEIAAALTRIILSKQKIHDTLLFMTLLQTSLRDLKRRGFNVDRIMNARKAEQEAVEKKQREERAEADLRRVQQAADMEKAAQPPYGDDRSRRDSLVEKRPLIEDTASSPPLVQTSSAKSLFNNLRSKLKGQNPLVPGPAIASAAGESSHSRDSVSDLMPPALPPRTGSSGPSDPNSRITPTANIANNVLNAVRASRPDRSGNITSQTNTEEVKESGAYCDSTPMQDLDFVTEVLGVRFYVSRELNNPSDGILQRHHEALKRYIEHVVKPVGKIYNVDPRALHVFYDKAGPTIAFNRSGSLFFNLRYHLAWHGDKARAGNLGEALISTYFSMAHELAHNLVLPHNSEHSFYTSALAQTYFIPMAGYIAETEGALPVA